MYTCFRHYLTAAWTTRQNTNQFQQVCIPVGSVPPACWPYPVISRGGVCLGEVCPGGEVYPSMQWHRHPPVSRITDRCKNTTLPQTSFAGGNENSTLIDINEYFFKCYQHYVWTQIIMVNN